MMATDGGKGNLLYCRPTQMLISSRNILTDACRIIFNQVSGHPMAQSTHKINHHKVIHNYSSRGLKVSLDLNSKIINLGGTEHSRGYVLSYISLIDIIIDLN